MSDISDLDLNLLKALGALLDTRSASRSAERLGVSQPAVSGMLSRLRVVFDDELFVRARRGLVPTPRAEALAAPLRSVLAQVEAVLRPERFDPARETTTFSIAATDYAQKVVVLPLVLALRGKAPGIRIAARPVTEGDLAAPLEQGTLDMALVTPEMAPGTLVARRLFDEEYAWVLRKDHPSARRPLDLDAFCGLDHAIMSHDGTRFAGATDAALTALGRSRRVVAAVPSFTVLVDMVRCSDLAAMIPRRMLDGTTGLLVRPPPLPVPGFTKILVWHERQQHDATHSWLRDLIAEVARPNN